MVKYMDRIYSFIYLSTYLSSFGSEIFSDCWNRQRPLLLCGNVSTVYHETDKLRTSPKVSAWFENGHYSGVAKSAGSTTAMNSYFLNGFCFGEHSVPFWTTLYQIKSTKLNFFLSVIGFVFLWNFMLHNFWKALSFLSQEPVSVGEADPKLFSELVGVYLKLTKVT